MSSLQRPFRVCVLSLTTAALVLSLAGAASAAVIRYDFSGDNFTFQTIGGISLPTEITNLSTFAGSLEYDNVVPDSAGSTSTGFFSGAGISIDSSFDTGFSVSGTNGNVTQSRYSSPSGLTSSLSIDSFGSMGTTLVTELNLVAINVSLSDFDDGGQQLFVDPNLLIAALPAPQLLDGLKRLELVFTDGQGGTAYVRGELTALATPVPAPASGLLLVVGLVTIGLFQFQQRRRAKLMSCPIPVRRRGMTAASRQGRVL